MLFKKRMSKDELLLYYNDFKKKYKNVLNEEELIYIHENCELGNHDLFANYILNQFYVEFDLIEEEKNIYLNVLKKLKEVFSINGKRILEIGGGPIPQFAKLISNDVESITVMDPCITFNNGKDNIHTERRYFTPFTDITNYDIIVALMACKTSESIIYNCMNNKKDFFIVFCPCLNEDLNKIISFANNMIAINNMGVLKEEELKEQPDFNNPILYNKRGKMMTYKRDV